jgi:rare lipoprotein A
VVNLDNGRSAILKIVDRGPFIRGRVIDVSPAAASALGFRQAGLAHVRIERIWDRPGQPEAGAGPRSARKALNGLAAASHQTPASAYRPDFVPEAKGKPAGTSANKAAAFARLFGWRPYFTNM